MKTDERFVKINRERTKENMKGSESFVRRIVSELKCNELYHSIQTKVQSVFLGKNTYKTSEIL